MNTNSRRIFRISLVWLVMAALLAAALVWYAGQAIDQGADRETRTLDGVRLIADTATLSLNQSGADSNTWTGTLDSSDPACEANRTIIIQRKNEGANSWGNQATTTTNSSGAYTATATDRADKNDTYRAYAPAVLDNYGNVICTEVYSRERTT